MDEGIGPPTHKSRHRGHLFVLEGIDGAGKTVVCESVLRILLEDGTDAVRLREPTKESRWGKEIWERSRAGTLSPSEELDLFMLDRRWNVENRIRPALESGKVVVMDRYFFATGAYQSTSTGIDWREILRRNREEVGAPEPDLVFLLDLPVDEALRRVGFRTSEPNRQFERMERLVRVRQNYLEMAREDSANYVVVDATQSVDQVIHDVYCRIYDWLRGQT
ncbi:MAG: dTMP kinase [Candidatus Thorarchaeota archaeon]|nr:dTMP kinase [Candidatus Thorarchaeota archaeon]